MTDAGVPGAPGSRRAPCRLHRSSAITLPIGCAYADVVSDAVEDQLMNLIISSDTRVNIDMQAPGLLDQRGARNLYPVRLPPEPSAAEVAAQVEDAERAGR